MSESTELIIPLIVMGYIFNVGVGLLYCLLCYVNNTHQLYLNLRKIGLYSNIYVSGVYFKSDDEHVRMKNALVIVMVFIAPWQWVPFIGGLGYGAAISQFVSKIWLPPEIRTARWKLFNVDLEPKLVAEYVKYCFPVTDAQIQNAIEQKEMCERLRKIG